MPGTPASAGAQNGRFLLLANRARARGGGQNDPDRLAGDQFSSPPSLHGSMGSSTTFRRTCARPSRFAVLVSLVLSTTRYWRRTATHMSTTTGPICHHWRSNMNVWAASPPRSVMRLLTPLKISSEAAKKRAEPYTKIVEELPEMQQGTVELVK
jgi:hypothetical protein